MVHPRPEAVIVGLGQLGRTLAEGLVMTGWTVTGVRRGEDPAALPRPELAVIATGEDDLAPALASMPASWREHRILLLQNELLPYQWETASVVAPTVLVVWFSRKPGELIRELRPSIAWGPHTEHARDALGVLGLHTEVVEDERSLLAALVEKNTYIWAMNLAALIVEQPTTSRVLGPAGEGVFEALAREAIAVQHAAIGRDVVDADSVVAAVHATLAGEGERRLGGRSARRRAERLVELARRLGVPAPTAELALERS